MTNSLEALVRIPAVQRDRSWFHKVLPAVLWSDAMGPLLEHMGYGWCDGGCHSCARGIEDYLLQSDTICPGAVDVVVIADRWTPAQHVVVCVTYQGERWYLDANGVQTEEQLLAYWTQEEGLPAPRIEDSYDAEWLEEEIPFLPCARVTVTTLLMEVLGPFSWQWLAVSGTS